MVPCLMETTLLTCDIYVSFSNVFFFYEKSTSLEGYDFQERKQRYIFFTLHQTLSKIIC